MYRCDFERIAIGRKWLRYRSEQTVYTPKGRKTVNLVRAHPNTPYRKDEKMNRRIKKQFWLSPQDARELKRKAKLCGITETAVIRILLHGYEPKEKPDARFYEAMRQLSAIGNNINQLAVKANALGFIDAPMLKAEALRWHRFQADIEAVFLRPGASNLKWQ